MVRREPRRARQRIVRVALVLLVAGAVFAMSQAAAALAVGDSPDRPVFAIGVALFVVGAALVALSRMVAAPEPGAPAHPATPGGTGVQSAVSDPSPVRH
jgi:hypothetical protein